MEAISIHPNSVLLTLTRCIVVLFGLFIISIGVLMLLAPTTARQTLRKAGSTNLINYTEITLRLIPAIALILCSNVSRYPEVFRIFGWFMFATSIVLYVVPRKIHHGFSVRAADMLTPLYVRLIAPFAFLFGGAIIYCVI